MEKKKIFVVEDESIVSLEIQSRLKSLGYIVSGSASSGDEAIRKIIDLKPDLILMDVQIKGEMDGIETASEVKKIYDVPIIFLTAYADPATIQRAKITDPFGYIVKPFEERELQINIEIALYKDHTQKLLREKDKWLSTILKSIGDAVIATDRSGKVKFMNRIAEHLTGYSKEEAINNHLDTIFKIRNEITKEPVNNPVKKVLETGEIVGLANHTELISKDGVVLPIADSGAPILDDNDNIQGVVMVFQDMSYYKKTEELIKTQTTALNTAYNGVIITDVDGNIIWCNQSMERLTGYKVSELLNNRIEIFKSDQQDDSFYDEMYKTISNGNAWSGEIKNRKKNGEIYYEFLTVTPLKDEHGKITHYISVKDDITERKLQELEVKKAKERAEKSDKLKSEFLAQMSHEIRTPIHIISNFMQLYEDDLNQKLSPELRKSITSVKAESHRIIATIESIVNMAQLNVGTFKTKLKKLNLREEVIKPLLDKWLLLADAKNLEFIVSGSLNDSYIQGDSYSLAQALDHIVDNAIKYTEKGKIQLHCKSEDENIVISVTDTGIGISEEYIPNIFEPFSQESQGLNRKYEGNGLGMALVKQYCSLNNASITIESKKNVGTTVKVSLPKIKKGG